LDRVCYSSLSGEGADYIQQGHAQVVRVSLPEASITDFTKAFLEEVPKRKIFDKGPQFRPLIGLRGGLQAGVFPKIAEAAEGRAQLVKGNGNDPDTLGTQTGKETPTVYVYDAKAFPFRFAENSNQFHPDPPDSFESDYRELKLVLSKAGVISGNGCL